MAHDSVWCPTSANGFGTAQGIPAAVLVADHAHRHDARSRDPDPLEDPAREHCSENGFLGAGHTKHDRGLHRHPMQRQVSELCSERKRRQPRNPGRRIHSEDRRWNATADASPGSPSLGPDNLPRATLREYRAACRIHPAGGRNPAHPGTQTNTHGEL